MSQANKELVRRWFDEVWNQGREETIDELLASDAVAHGLGEGEVAVRGPAEFKPFVHNLRGSIPDIHISVEDIVAEGDRVAARILLTGTHIGTGLGVAASGREIRVAGIVLVRVSGRQVVEGWNSWDQLGLLRQTGALPSGEGADRFVTAAKTVAR